MSLEAEVQRLKEERHAAPPRAQLPGTGGPGCRRLRRGLALPLPRRPPRPTAPVIVFAGVRFMAETAKILNPRRRCSCPDLKAGCALADSITVEELREWKASTTGAAVVSYINTSAEVKAESDYVCTSSNAAQVVESVPAGREILFLPDMFLGEYVRKITGRPMHLWVGDCPVHAKMRPEDLEQARGSTPGGGRRPPPECGCSTAALPNVDRILSTDGMVRFAEETRAPAVLVATEVGILHRMRRLNPTTEFPPLSEGTICPYMKQIDLADIRDSLELGRYEIDVPLETARRARGALERMIAS